MYNDYLMHHGVKGMRWGVRRRSARPLIGVRRKRSILTDEQRREGAREDAQTYKYQKAGESGWKGMGRAIKAKTVGADNATKKRRKTFVKGMASAALAGGAVGRATGWNKEIRELGDFTNDRKSGINMRTINRRTAVGAALGAGTYAAAYAHAVAKRKKKRK